MTARPYILAENNYKFIKNTSYDLAVLPWGATEAHNYHLPYATDNIEAEAIAGESARIAWEKGAKLIVLPVVPFGVNTGQQDIPLDMNMNPSTQMAVLRDLIDVLNRQGIHKLVILNSHGGNDFKPLIRELGLQFPKMFISSCDWFRAVDQSTFFENKDDHAGEMETSLLLHLRPELVDMSVAGDGLANKFKFKAMQEGWAWAERKWSEVTRDTGVGDPRKASAAKGEKYFKEVTKKVSDYFFEVAKTPTDNLYEN